MPARPTFDASTANERRIAQWLGTALDGYINDDMGRWAFRPLEDYIGGGDDLADDLCAIHNSLAATSQARWRGAVRNMLATHGRDPNKRESIRVLIDFAVLVRAAEVLDVLPGILSGSEDGEVLDLAVGAATALANQTEASRKCLERIRTSPAFTPDYAGLILQALCHVDPDNWMHHVQELAEPMRRLASLLPSESTALRFYANNILHAISLSRVTETALDYLYEKSSDEPCWLRKEWFDGKNSLLLTRHTATGPRLALRAKDELSTKLELGSREDQTAIAWAMKKSERTWIAVCRLGELTLLDHVAPSQEALIAFISDRLGNDIAVDWPTQTPERGEMMPASDSTSTKVLSLLYPATSTQFTKRIDHLGRRGKHIDHHFRRIAINNPLAFDAVARALELGSNPTSLAIT